MPFKPFSGFNFTSPYVVCIHVTAMISNVFIKVNYWHNVPKLYF